MAHVTHKIEISVKSILLTMLVIVSVYFLYQIRDILLFIFIGIMIMAAINPLAARLERFHLSRGLSIAISYVSIISAIILFVALIVPPLIGQLISIINQIPIPQDVADLFIASSLSLQDLQIIANQLTSVPKIISAIGSAFSALIIIFSLLVMSFYLLIERKNLHKYLKMLYKNEAKANKAEKFISQVEHEIGAWVRAEFILMIIVGVLTYIGLSLLGIKYALALAIIAGLLEIVPNIGPTISAIPAIVVAYITISPLMALVVIALYILIQQMENNFIVPIVMRQTVGLSPVITIILLLIGYRLAGVAGAAFAVPIFLTGKVVALKLYELRDQIET